MHNHIHMYIQHLHLSIPRINKLQSIHWLTFTTKQFINSKKSTEVQ